MNATALSGPDAAPCRDLGRIAHDLNDRLMSIVSNADLILYDDRILEDVREEAAEIRKAAEGIRVLSEEIVEWERAARAVPGPRALLSAQRRLPL